MAEILLNAALTKLTQFCVQTGLNKAVEKALSLCGIKKEVEKLKHELKFIQATIKDADQKCILDHKQMEWVKMIMDIAYDIEDAIDIFLLECPEQLPGPSIIDRLKRPVNKMAKVPFLCKFQEDIKEIQGKIREVEDYKRRYGIKDLGEIIEGEDHTLKLDPIDDPEVEGFAEDIKKVVSYLLDEDYENLAVVSIVGTGGLGKTTLASKIFKSDKVTNYFAKLIWITISQKYDLLDILRKIAKNLEIDSADKDENVLANKIHEFLSEKRYLIILDDVWTEKLWTQIEKALPNVKNGSRILITTRIEDVARSADTKYEPYDLPCLDEAHSLKLFLKKAIPKNCQCPDQNDDLYKIAKEFAKKCKGLPLALVVLGGLLCKRPLDFHAWDRLYKNMNWGREGSECSKIIATSYEHLPLAKKLCFLYFAAFPEDKTIDAKSLIRMWVAENLIPHGGRTLLEETAADFLQDLVQRYHSHCFDK